MPRRELPPGTGWATNVSDLTDLFRRWGDAGTNIQALWNVALPVVLVDRFRGEDEGSLFGIQAFSNGANSEFSNVAFGSGVNDWEIHSITVVERVLNPPGTLLDFGWHYFTPIAPFNPVTTVDPVGFFEPGLITDRGFTFGTVLGVGGSNPATPNPQGPIGWLQALTGGTASYRMMPLDDHYDFDPPLRIPQDTTFVVGMITALVGRAIELRVSLIYNERPRR